MNNVKRIITGIILAVLIVGAAPQPASATRVAPRRCKIVAPDQDHDRGELDAIAEGYFKIDYLGKQRRWIGISDPVYGTIKPIVTTIGWARTEDSTIWNRKTCIYK